MPAVVTSWRTQGAPVAPPGTAVVTSKRFVTGGTLPPEIAAGDRILLCGISDHAAAAGKTMTVPAGFTPVSPLGPFVTANYIPDTMWCTKIAGAADAGAVVNFGGTSAVHCVVLRGAVSTLTAGPTVAEYGTLSASKTVTAAGFTAPAAGYHVVCGVCSGSPADTDLTATPASALGYTALTPFVEGYGGAQLFGKAVAAGAVPAVSIASTANATSVASLALSSIVVS